MWAVLLAACLAASMVRFGEGGLLFSFVSIQTATLPMTTNASRPAAVATGLPSGMSSATVLTYSPLRVSFVNGIHHSESEWRNLTLSLSEVFGDQVRAFYNPSSGWWVKDAAKAGYELVRRPNDLGLAKKLAEHLRSVLKEVGPSGRVLHLAHSGGAILTYLAAKYHLTSQETDRIDLATFGGGRSITRKYFKGRIVNYYSRNDPLTLVDGRAGALMKFAKNSTYCEVRDRKHNTTFIYLQGLAGDPLRDHSMFGPTYVMALRLEAANFRHRLSLMTTAIATAEANWVRKMRKSTARVTGLRHFWGNSAANVQSTIRDVRKKAAKTTKRRGFFSGKGLSRVSATNVTAAVGSRAASQPATASWRARAAQSVAVRMGRYYPSSWLSTVSSSEAYVEGEVTAWGPGVEGGGAKEASLSLRVLAASREKTAVTAITSATRFPSLSLASLNIPTLELNGTLSSTWAAAAARWASAKALLRASSDRASLAVRDQLQRVQNLTLSLASFRNASYAAPAPSEEMAPLEPTIVEVLLEDETLEAPEAETAAEVEVKAPSLAGPAEEATPPAKSSPATPSLDGIVPEEDQVSQIPSQHETFEPSQEQGGGEADMEQELEQELEQRLPVVQELLL